MASNDTEIEHALRAVWIPTIPPLSSDELKERLGSLLELQGDTIESFEAKLHAEGLIRLVGANKDDSSTSPPSSHFSPNTSPSTSTEHSPTSATTTTEPERSNSDSENIFADMKADIPKRGPSPTVHADASLVASMAALTVGEEAPKDMEFCPWRMVQHYPDWFVGKANTPRVSFSSSGFFALWDEA